MTAGIRPLTASPAWKSLEAHHQKIRELHLRELFSDPCPTNHPGTRIQGTTRTRARQFNQLPDQSLPQTEGGHVMNLGYNKDLYVQPFDDRGSFQVKLFGWGHAVRIRRPSGKIREMRSNP
jgi:hypothetical protein